VLLCGLKATRGSVLYFVIADMAMVDSMYQYSLPAFTRLYNLRMDRSKKSEVSRWACRPCLHSMRVCSPRPPQPPSPLSPLTPPTLPVLFSSVHNLHYLHPCGQVLEERLSFLIDDITLAFYVNVCRGLFEVHKLLYSFLIAAQVLSGVSHRLVSCRAMQPLASSLCPFHRRAAACHGDVFLLCNLRPQPQVMRNKGDITADEWQLLLVANSVKDDSRYPQPEATKAWLDPKVGRIQALLYLAWNSVIQARIRARVLTIRPSARRSVCPSSGPFTATKALALTHAPSPISHFLLPAPRLLQAWLCLLSMRSVPALAPIVDDIAAK
jgi:hypothetical protein